MSSEDAGAPTSDLEALLARAARALRRWNGRRLGPPRLSRRRGLLEGVSGLSRAGRVVRRHGQPALVSRRPPLRLGLLWAPSQPLSGDGPPRGVRGPRALERARPGGELRLHEQRRRSVPARLVARRQHSSLRPRRASGVPKISAKNAPAVTSARSRTVSGGSTSCISSRSRRGRASCARSGVVPGRSPAPSTSGSLRGPG
jgi:hypothetical protein